MLLHGPLFTTNSSMEDEVNIESINDPSQPHTGRIVFTAERTQPPPPSSLVAAAMRLRSTVVAVIGLLAGPVRGQYRNGLGNVNGLAPRSWPQAVAESPRLSERDGSCAGGQHPCMRSILVISRSTFRFCTWCMRAAPVCGAWLPRIVRASAPMLRCVEKHRGSDHLWITVRMSLFSI